MNILLLEDAIYLPSYRGDSKANRLLLEQLSELGHRSVAIAPALNRGVHLNTEAEVERQLEKRGVRIERRSPDVSTYRHRGVRVWAVRDRHEGSRAAFARERIAEERPDWIVVSSHQGQRLLEVALEAAPQRTVALAHGLFDVPFGPLRLCPEGPTLLGAARAVITVSRFAQEYLRTYGQISALTFHLPVYGSGPHPRDGMDRSGPIVLINPCPSKGLDLFLALAARFPHRRFVGVPTWGGAPQTLERLAAVENVELRPPADDIGEILSGAAALLVPSVFTETFGYVAVDGMLRGIPVLAADIGGLPEAKLEVPYLLPVRPAVRGPDGFEFPEQDVEPWAQALGELLDSQATYDRISRQSHEAAVRFVSSLSAARFVELLDSLD